MLAISPDEKETEQMYFDGQTLKVQSENDEMSSEFGQYDRANNVLSYLGPVRL